MTATSGGRVFRAQGPAIAICAALYTFTLLATVVVEGGLNTRFQQRRQTHMLETIKDHFVICGAIHGGDKLVVLGRAGSLEGLESEASGQ